MKKIVVLVILSFLLIPVKAQAKASSITVGNGDPLIDFPTGITFKADLSADSSIQKVKLHYGVLQDTCGTVSAIAYPAITPGASVSAQWEWDMRQSGGEPPGATIWWQWEVIDSQGNSQMSDRQQILWLDSTHDWKMIEKGQIRLHYYYNDQQYGQTLADTADNALTRLAQDIGMVAAEPIDLYIYQSTEDMRDAVFYEPGWTGGLAYSDYNILLIGIDPFNLDWGKSTEAHELTHILAGDYMFSCLGASPTWLDEGLAVYGEGGPTSSEAAAFQQSVAKDELLSFSVLTGGFSEDPQVADLSYSQSYYMVNYLIHTYGKEKMLDLLGAIRRGDEINEALFSSYGFDLTDFENEWRQSLGLAPVSIDMVEDTPQPTPIPTIHPIQGMSLSVTAPNEPVAKLTPGATQESPLHFTETTPQPGQTSFSQQLRDWLGNNLLLLIIGFILASLVFLVIVILIVNRKGGRQ